MAKPFEMYVFDWDGTLMDTTRLIMQGLAIRAPARHIVLGYIPSQPIK